jgi:hypothetical protein
MCASRSCVTAFCLANGGKGFAGNVKARGGNGICCKRVAIRGVSTAAAALAAGGGKGFAGNVKGSVIFAASVICGCEGGAGVEGGGAGGGEGREGGICHDGVSFLGLKIK